MARVRSRIGWLKEGDANTALFHSQARHRKRKNFISKLISNDQVLTSHEEKASEIFSYETLLGSCEQRENSINLDNLELSHHNLSDLELPFSEEEVWNTIKHLPSDKAPGPHGYTGRFYKMCWNIIKPDVLAALAAVQSGNFRNLQLLNTALLTLLPKKEDAVLVRVCSCKIMIHLFHQQILLLYFSSPARLDPSYSPAFFPATGSVAICLLRLLCVEVRDDDSSFVFVGTLQQGYPLLL